ncbi:MAG TPA: carboxypeptidase-like regulatory domain-containing protein [Terriglobales bacterium]|nr:carboxypeptidase-like regulatory domain-containing protein [Terriglobales bacterium]
MNMRRVFPAVMVALLASLTSAHAAAQPTDMFSISGTVVNAKEGGPLSKVRLVVSDVRNSENLQSLLTGEDGRFKFRVRAGKYSLQAAKRGYISSAYNQHEQYSTAIVAGAGLNSENLKFRMSPAAVLSGKVLDDAGDPVRDASITLYREDHRSGVSRIRTFRKSKTDDQGYYEFTPLEDGTYFISAMATPWYAFRPSRGEGKIEGADENPSLDVAYPITFYAGATESDEATPIPIRGGDRLDVDIHLAPVPALHFVFHVDGDPTRAFQTPVLQKPVFDGFDYVQSGDVRMLSPGTYESAGVAAGRYVIGTQGGEGRDSEIELANDGQEIENAPQTPAVEVRASVQVAGENVLPAKLELALRNSNQKLAAWSSVDEKGNASFAVVPGRYVVLAGSPGKAYSVARISFGGVQTAGRLINVPTASTLNLSLTLVGGAVTVEGVAKRASQPVPGAMIVLIPKDPETDKDMFRRDQSDSDGSFALQGVIPGTYTIIAIEDGWDLDWAKPGVIAGYGRNGRSVTIGSQETGTLKLKQPIEVQPK